MIYYKILKNDRLKTWTRFLSEAYSETFQKSKMES